MEVREDLRLEKLLNGNKLPAYADARDMESIPEWKMRAGELKRIPQYYKAIHAYSDTLDFKAKDRFYYQTSLEGWEVSLRNSISATLPISGFYELKQEIYDISRKRTNMSL